VIGFTYDGMGNVTNDGANTYTYDAERRPLTVGGVQITYDAFGRAVEQNRTGTYTQILYSPMGQKFGLMNGSAVKQYFVPLAGGVQAVYNSSGLQYYRHSDWLGSSRFAGTTSGTVYYDGAYAPFGENYAETGTTDRSFTGQTQDTVNGLYDFLFRQQSSAQGRWLVPDPAGLAAVDLTNPQTWNRYAYVTNDPCDQVDPLGLFASTCQFNIKINGQNLLSGPQLSDAEGEINRILGSNNSGLGANFSGGSPDFTISLKDNPSGLLGLLIGVSNDKLGEADSSFWTGAIYPTGSIWVNNVAGQNFSIGLGTAIGRATTHEFAHWAFQVPHNNIQPGLLETNILQPGFGIYTNSANASLSQAQTGLLQQKCQQLHGPGGGGSGGGAMGGGSMFFQPTPVWSSGSETFTGFGFGTWIPAGIVGGSGGIFRMHTW
jgi:RHS repeat-associated protein